MLMEQATTVRKKWSAVCDSVIHEKPKFIKRTRDKMWFSNLETISEILEAYHFTAMKYIEDDGSVTLSLNEIDLVENGKNEQEARYNLAKSILEYSLDYYNEYEMQADAVPGPAHPAGDPDPGRAHHRSGPRLPAADLGPAAGAEPPGHDHPAHHPLHRRGPGAVRPHRPH